MVSAENRKALYITIPIYFGLLMGCTYWAYRRMQTMEKNHTADKLSCHYIGGRSFGPLLLTGTLFASIYSGYTVVGIPNEAFRTGWLALRWMPSFVGIVWGLIGTSFRLRKVSQYRNHQSPVDFITDRFQSQLLRYTIVFLQVVTSVIYLAAQVIAIKSTFNSIFGLNSNEIYPVIIIMICILVFECIGGLNSVALTDSIQAVIMIFAFISIPIIIRLQFGGWSTLTPETYPRPEFYQTPSADSQVMFWQFALINFSFFTLPHFIQRIYAAKDLKSLKIGYAVLTVGPWISAFVGIFMGTVGVAMLVNEDGTPLENVSDPFTSILEKIMDLGGFAEGCASIAITASLAAIMSTADSLIIAVSQLLCVEIIYPIIPNSTPARMAWYGRLSSLISVIFALIVGLAWDEGITDLGRIQFPLTMQVVPSFLIGLFSYNKVTDIHPWCIVFGAISSSFYVFGIYFGYLKHDFKNPLAMDSGITGVVIQLIIMFVTEIVYRIFITKKGLFLQRGLSTINKIKNTPIELLYPDRPAWDIPKMSRFGGNESTLTPQLIWDSMDGFFEPMTNLSWVCLMFFSVSFTTPLLAQFEPPFADDGTFVYPPTIINGLPWWAFKIIIIVIFPYVLLFAAIYQIPDDFPLDDENKIISAGVDNINLVPLTRTEMGRRSSYDESNGLIHRRRSTISNTMEDMGIRSSIRNNNMNNNNETSTTPSPSQKRLSNLVLGRNLTQFLEDEDDNNNNNNSNNNNSNSKMNEEEVSNDVVIDC